jgi:hypothetical protein
MEAAVITRRFAQLAVPALLLAVLLPVPAAWLESEAAQQRRAEERAARARLKEEQQAAGGAPDFYFDTHQPGPRGQVVERARRADRRRRLRGGAGAATAPQLLPPRPRAFRHLMHPGFGKGMSNSPPREETRS